jgi:hypothetical protein
MRKEEKLRVTSAFCPLPFAFPIVDEEGGKTKSYFCLLPFAFCLPSFAFPTVD